MSLSSLRRWTMVLAGAGLLGVGGITRGDDASQKASPPPLTSTATERSAAPSIADPLAGQVDEAIRVTSRRFLDAEVHTPWQIMHGMLAYRREYMLRFKGQKVNALEWIANGATYQGQPWFEKSAGAGPCPEPLAYSPSERHHYGPWRGREKLSGAGARQPCLPSGLHRSLHPRAKTRLCLCTSESRWQL